MTSLEVGYQATLTGNCERYLQRLCEPTYLITLMSTTTKKPWFNYHGFFDVQKCKIAGRTEAFCLCLSLGILARGVFDGLLWR